VGQVGNALATATGIRTSMEMTACHAPAAVLRGVSVGMTTVGNVQSQCAVMIVSTSVPRSVTRHVMLMTRAGTVRAPTTLGLGVVNLRFTACVS
jgi:hypothetical protein